MKDLSALKEKVFKANLDLVKHNLVIFTWGNVLGINRDEGCQQRREVRRYHHMDAHLLTCQDVD